jgi:hypothetical protein
MPELAHSPSRHELVRPQAPAPAPACARISALLPPLDKPRPESRARQSIAGCHSHLRGRLSRRPSKSREARSGLFRSSSSISTTSPHATAGSSPSSARVDPVERPAERALVGDTNPHVIELYQGLQSGELCVADLTEHLLAESAHLRGSDEQHFYAVRERFNADPSSPDFLFLNHTCFNGCSASTAKAPSTARPAATPSA